MVGRIPVMDVTPLVDRGAAPRRRPSASPSPSPRRSSARATTSSAPRWSSTDPDGGRRDPVRMEPDAEVPDLYRRLGDPRRRGRLDLRGRGLVRPAGDLAPRRRHQDPGRRRRRADVHRGRACCSSGSAAARPARTTRAGPSPRPRSRPPRDTTRPDEARLAALLAPRGPRRAAHATRCASWSPSRAPSRAYADRDRALYGSWYEFFPRSEGATHDAETGAVASGTFRTAAERLAGRRRDGLRRHLPAADPPDRRGQPQGPQQHPHAGPRRHRLAVGDRQQGRRPRRHPPRPRRLRGLRRLRRPGPRARPRGRARPRAAGGARPPLGRPTHPEWFTTRADGTIAYAENPPKKYQDIYPVNFDNDPEGLLRRGAADRAALDVARRADLPRRQPAHQAGRRSGSGCSARSAAPTPTCSSSPRRSPGRR